MNLADLYVRIRGDVADVNTKIASLEAKIRSLEVSGGRLNNSLGETHLKTGRLGNAFEALATRIAGVNPIVGKLAGVLGDFALGGAVTAGVLGGVAAIAIVYDQMTKAAREAEKANRALIDSLAKSNFTAALGPEPDLVLQTNAQRNELRQKQSRRRTLLNFGVSPDDERILTLDREITNATKELAAGEERLLAARLAATKPLDTVTVKGHDFAGDAAKAAAAALQADEAFWRGQGELWKQATGRIADLNETARQYLLDNPTSKLVGDLIKGNLPTSVSMPNVDINDSLTNEQKKQREKMGILIEDSNKNAEKLSNAIWGSAIALGNQIVGALNLGGGGKGSSLGGAIGATAGFVAGSLIPVPGGQVVGQAVGSLLGNIAGSLFGGLFDHHTRAVNSNTDAVRQLTQALLLNEPGGFRVASYRYAATAVGGADVEAIATAQRRRASRGGTVPL